MTIDGATIKHQAKRELINIGKYYKPMTAIWIYTPVLALSRLGITNLFAPNTSPAINLIDERLYGVLFTLFLAVLCTSNWLHYRNLKISILSIGAGLFAMLAVDVYPVFTSMTWHGICAGILFIESGRVRKNA
jgi:hypothetical protein